MSYVERTTSEGPAVVIELSDASRRLLQEAIKNAKNLSMLSGHTIMTETIRRLCGTRGDNGALDQPAGFVDGKDASERISFVMGSLAASLGNREDSHGNFYRKKYNARNAVLMAGVSQSATLDERENVIKEIEAQCTEAGVALFNGRPR